MDAAERADANFATHSIHGVRGLPGSSILDGHGIVRVDSGLHCDTFNVVCCARLRAADATAQISDALKHFRDAARPFSWWVSPADRPPTLGRMLEDAGLTHQESSLCMSADLAILRATDLSPEGLEVRRVRTGRMLADVARIHAGWEEPDPVVLRFYELASPVLVARDSPRWFFAGYLDGEPVSAAEVTVADGVAGLYGVVTREPYRRRGFGTALTAAPLIEARAAGCLTGVLQASEAGAGVYRRLGFEAFGEVREFK